MASLEYNRSTGKLSWKNNQGDVTNVWNATSGPSGNGALPVGKYRIGDPNGNNVRTDLASGFNVPTTNTGFFIPIYPYFYTTRKGLGIHPDGNTAGTAGCIGISNNALAFFNFFVTTNPRPTQLRVI